MPLKGTHNQLLDDRACYAAMLAHDSRFDGRFFCGVSSTGIYCRPICRVKPPKEENCSFFISAAAAEAAGYRPCLRCRPELAPGLAPMDSVTRLVRIAAFVMEEDLLTDRTMPELAIMLGITDRHLRRVFSAEHGVSPVQYLQTRKENWDTSRICGDGLRKATINREVSLVFPTLIKMSNVPCKIPIQD